MAKTLRQRIERLITQTDMLHIELQSRIRAVLKEEVAEQKFRKQILYKILEDKVVNDLLRLGKLDDAEDEAMSIMEKLKLENAESLQEERK